MIVTIAEQFTSDPMMKLFEQFNEKQSISQALGNPSQQTIIFPSLSDHYGKL